MEEEDIIQGLDKKMKSIRILKSDDAFISRSLSDDFMIMEGLDEADVVEMFP